MDVGTRVELHDLMRELQAGGTTIILATHDMAEAEKMADRVAILLKGKIAATGSPAQLTATGSGLVKVSVSSEMSSLGQNEGIFPAVSQQLVKDEYVIYYSADAGETVPAILDYLKVHDDHLVDLRVERPYALEDRFLEITQPQPIELRQIVTAFFHHFTYDFRTGLRDKTLLLMNYLFPLGFYILMGLLMTGLNPTFAPTMIPAMILVGGLRAELR